ncbi:O-antigen ligase family protein [Mobilicoccus sp.]|uniref:O-antigen ligase family protein n=1 Tax=Mobilicoccus sp. TaxID=2034349 RepID=UPI0028AE3740|nr:O-antigen ligase family protein [Mobilicoccus sp.]
MRGSTTADSDALDTPRLPGGTAATVIAGVLTAVLVLTINAGRLVNAPLTSAGLLWQVYLGSLALGVAAVVGTRRWRHPAVWGLLLFWLVGAAWMPYARAIAPDARLAAREILNLSYCAVLSSAVLLLGRRAPLFWWRLGWVFALGLAGSIAVWEMVTMQHLFLDPWPFEPRTAVATYGNPNNLGILTLSMLVAILAWRAGSRSRGMRAFLAVAALAAAGLVIASESRSAVLGLLIVVGLDLARRLREHPGLVREVVATRRRLVASLAGLATVVLIATFVVPPLAARNPVVRMVNAAMQPETAAADLFRVKVSILGLRYWRESGYLGTGAGSFEPLMWNDPNSGIAIEANLHNAFVEMLMQYGIVVFAVFTVLLVLLVRIWWTTRRPASMRPRVAIVRTELVGHLVVFAALGLTASSALTLTTWWLVLANACACAATLADLTSRTRPRPLAARVPSTVG